MIRYGRLESSELNSEPFVPLRPDSTHGVDEDDIRSLGGTKGQEEEKINGDKNHHGERI